MGQWCFKILSSIATLSKVSQHTGLTVQHLDLRCKPIGSTMQAFNITILELKSAAMEKILQAAYLTGIIVTAFWSRFSSLCRCSHQSAFYSLMLSASDCGEYCCQFKVCEGADEPETGTKRAYLYNFVFSICDCRTLSNSRSDFCGHEGVKRINVFIPISCYFKGLGIFAHEGVQRVHFAWTLSEVLCPICPICYLHRQNARITTFEGLKMICDV